MKTIAYSSPFVPMEWIAAHGLRPSRMRLRPAELEPRVGVIREVCPYTQAFLGAVLSDPEACGVVMTTTCDQMRHAAGLLQRHTAHPVFLMNVPATWQTAAARGLYLDELKRFGRFLVGLGGTAPSPGDLADVMLEHQSTRTALRHARQSMSARQFAEAVAAVGDGQQGTVYSRSIAPSGRAGSDGTTLREPRPSGRGCQSTQEREVVHGQVLGPAAGGVPLALLGGPLLQSDYAILDLIEQAGGRLVLDATEGGERTMPGAFDRRAIRDDPLRALSKAYFDTIPDPFRRPNTRFYEWLGEELGVRGVRGVLLRRYVWCDLWHAELHRLREWSPVPVLDIDTCHDEEGSLDRLAGRIEAFLEMLIDRRQ
ncbi:MAG: 2-hydroxyacyl-CoA dehydratase [Planctomycetota bacterium]|jgi:benzoyl-CoA reductase/2-hydroxyglutaryl-CoA dehydratase subunit BcrC/BadD/HgdB